ncbi:MAG: hypothetical protein R3181_10630 [Rubricoccaceae bacterium]|nr:hypothetical protein [Rubricoccaceae bacterium]
MVSSLVTRVSAAVLLAGGLVLLFLPDGVLPALAPGVPPEASWLGQLLAAAWLGVAALNGLQRNAILGGVYGRPVVVANGVLYFVGAASLVRALLDGDAVPGLWALAALMATLAAAYGFLLFRGPFDAPDRSPAVGGDVSRAPDPPAR